MGLKRGGFGMRTARLVAKVPLKSDPAKTLQRRTWLAQGQGLTRNEPSGDKPKTPQRSSRNEVPHHVRQAVYRRDNNQCVRCGKRLESGNRQLQHRVPRGMGGRRNHARMSALILLCGSSATDPAGCHHHVESRRFDAQAGGWLVPMGSEPDDMPVLYADGVRYLLSDEGGKEEAP